MFNEVEAMFKAGWPLATQWILYSASGFSLRIRRSDGKYRALGRFEVHPREVLIVFYARAIELCPEEFKPCLAAIEYQTWKPNLEPLPEEGEQPEIQFKVTPEVWAAEKARLTALVRSVHEAWRSFAEDDAPR